MSDRKIIKTIEKLMPSVVSIVVTKNLKDLEKELPQEMLPLVPGQTEQKISIPDELVDARGMVQVGGGSGFIVGKDGIIVTNKHVLSDPKAEYTVILNDGRKFTGHILTRDPINDVAILKIDANKLPAVKLGDATKLKLGQTVIAIGNALGIFKNTVSLGIVSGLSRSISAQADPKSPPQEMRGLIQTDAAINPGNSGGPLVNINGEAVAINAAIVFGAQNIGFAIPINAVKRDLADFKKYGHIRRPLLGIRYITIDEKLADKLHLPVNYGSIVTRETPHDHGVVPGSPAEQAGIKEKDIVLECNGKKINRDHSIQDVLDSMEVGDELNLLVLRNNQEIKVSLKLSERK